MRNASENAMGTVSSKLKCTSTCCNDCDINDNLKHPQERDSLNRNVWKQSTGGATFFFSDVQIIKTDEVSAEKKSFQNNHFVSTAVVD